MTIAASFDRAAGYDEHAVVQRDVALELADTIVARGICPAPQVLEIGCGTGLLGAALVDSIGGRWLMTDIAPAMVARTAGRFAGREGVDVAVMDGEAPDRSGPFDLICSSLAMQWFADLPGSVRRLWKRLAPDGLLAFTTLIEGSFAEWRAAHGALTAGTPIYPTAEDLRALGLDVTIARHEVHHANARAFLRAVKGIGAGTPAPGHHPLAPRDLRAVMSRFEQSGAIAGYVVATCLARAPKKECI